MAIVQQWKPIIINIGGNGRLEIYSNIDYIDVSEFSKGSDKKQSLKTTVAFCLLS